MSKVSATPGVVICHPCLGNVLRYTTSPHSMTVHGNPTPTPSTNPCRCSTSSGPSPARMHAIRLLLTFNVANPEATLHLELHLGTNWERRQCGDCCGERMWARGSNPPLLHAMASIHHGPIDGGWRDRIVCEEWSWVRFQSVSYAHHTKFAVCEAVDRLTHSLCRIDKKKCPSVKRRCLA